MGTRSRIGMKQADGSVKSIYCHWDGYIEGVGKELAENYQDPLKVEKLISLGDISSLNERVEPDQGESHSFDYPIPSITVAYHRDRGEEYRVPKINENVEEYLHSDLEAYGYLYEEGKWFVADDEGKGWMLLEKSLWTAQTN